MLEYWNNGIMGSKRHRAEGRGQRVKNSYAMRYALCALLIFIPCARQKLKPQKIPLISMGCRISETYNYL
jgi:hypothetical protein